MLGRHSYANCWYVGSSKKVQHTIDRDEQSGFEFSDHLPWQKLMMWNSKEPESER